MFPVRTAFAAFLAVAALFFVSPQSAEAQYVPPDDYQLLTIFLKHDQSKTLTDIAAELKETGFWAKFPPKGIEVDSWYVVMGIGQVVTLRVPTGRLREVNVAVEKYGWSAFRTEFYPAYEFKGIFNKLRKRATGGE